MRSFFSWATLPFAGLVLVGVVSPSRTVAQDLAVAHAGATTSDVAADASRQLLSPFTSITNSTIVTSTGQRYFTCYTTCVVCDPNHEMFNDGYGPKGYNSIQQTTTDCIIGGPCPSSCAPDEQTEELLASAVKADDPNKLAKLLASNPLVRLNVPRQSVQLVGTCASAPIQANFSLSTKTVAALSALRSAERTRIEASQQ